MVNTGGHREASVPRMRLAFLSLAIVLLLSACSAGANLGEPEPPTPTPDADLPRPTPTRLPFAATQTAAVNEVPYIIERVVLATEVEDDGTPVNEVSALSEEQQNVFLSVRVRDIQKGMRFQARWYENDTIIGQSDERVEEVKDTVQWVALPFRSIARLNPAASHAVELIVNDRPINTFAFRVGIGDPTDVIAEATLALGTDEESQPIKPGDVFDRFAPQIVLVARISNMVDPTGMIFTSYWIRDGLIIDQRPPDGGQPRLDSDPPDPLDRQMTFTFVPQGTLIPGEYEVVVHLNGAEVETYSFSIVEEVLPTSTPAPTERVEPTLTARAADAELIDLLITDEIDNDGEPAGDAISSVEAYPGERVSLFVALELEDLRIENEVEFTISIDNSIVDRYVFPVAAFERGWLSTEVEFPAPDTRNDSVEYDVVVYLDNTRAGSVSLRIESTEDPPANARPTPTPR